MINKVLVYISTLLNPSMCELPSDFNSEYIDMLLCKITLRNLSFPILTVYRSPQASQTENEQMLAAIPYVCQLNTECLIVGDFNAPHIDWETLSCPSSEVFDAQLVDTLDNCLLCQHVDFKTRLGGLSEHLS